MKTTATKVWRLQHDSEHKMIVYFSNGDKRTFYSMDWKGVYSKVKDPSLGLIRFQKMIQNWGSQTTTILIYHIATDKLFHKFYKGQIVF